VAWLKTLLTLMLLAAVTLVGVMFALQNTVDVPLDLLVFQLPAQPISLWLLAALAVGVIMGLLAGTVITLRLWARLGVLRRQKDRLSTEIDRLRTVGLGDSD